MKAALFLVFSLVLMFYFWHVDAEGVVIPDPVLEAAIRRELDDVDLEDVELTEEILATIEQLEVHPAWNIFLQESDVHPEANRPICDLTGLEFCINLKDLEMPGQRITDIGPLASLSRLKQLWLDGNRISDISPLANLTSLIHLAIEDNLIADINPLSNLSNLRSLGLRDNLIREAEGLKYLTALEQLSLRQNLIGDISPLVSLKALTHLDISQNYIGDITPLADLDNLIWLNISSNSISNVSSLSNLSGLRELHANHNQIAEISALADFSQLRVADLSFNKITDISVLEDLAELTWLNISHNHITDISVLGNIIHPSTLDVSFNRIVDVAVLANFTYLTELDLSHNQISDVSILRELIYLTDLNLSYNQIADINSLEDLEYLSNLNLRGNQIRDIAPLVNNQNLGFRDSIDLRGNPLDEEAFRSHIPALEARGVEVKSDRMVADEGLPIISMKTRQVVSVEDFLSVAIRLDGAIGLAGFQLDIAFDPAMLEVVQINEGGLLSNSGETHWLEPDINSSSGVITGIICLILGERGVDGNGTLANIRFKAIGAGEAYIRFENSTLSDLYGNATPHLARDSSVTVEPFPPWDVNKDGRIDVSDLVLMAQYFGQDITTPLDPNPDVNGDGRVDIFDLVIIAQNFGNTYSLAAPKSDVWIYDVSYLPLLIRLYNIMEDNPDSDPGFIEAKGVLHKLIFCAVVSKTEVLQNYPNPFNPETWIPFQLSEGSNVQVSIYDSTGRLVKVFDLGYRDAGYYVLKEDAVYWDGSNEYGEKASSGIYVVALRAGDFTKARRIVLIR